MRKKIIIITLLGLILFACGKIKTTETPDAPIKVLKVLKKDIVKNHVLSDFIEIDSIISLELNDNSLIGEIYKIITTDDRIYVLDKKIAKSLFCFDKKGKFINVFKNIGNGPEQYEYLEYFDVYSDKIYLTAVPNKLIKLDKDLNFEEVIPVKWPMRKRGEFIGQRIKVLNNDTILFIGMENEYNFYYYDLKRKKFFSRLSKVTGTFTGVDVSTITLNGKNYIVESTEFNDTVCFVTPEKLIAHLIVEFEDPISPEIQRQLEVLYPLNRGGFKEEMHYIREFYETNDYIFFTFIYQRRHHVLLHNKNMLKTNILRNDINNDLFGSRFFPYTKGAFGNNLIVPVEASDLVENKNKIITEIPDGLNNNSNPVLIFFHPKF